MCIQGHPDELTSYLELTPMSSIVDLSVGMVVLVLAP